MLTATIRRTWILGMLTMLASCTESSGPGSGPGRPRSAALVSAPVAQPVVGLDGAVLVSHAYVSMPPGTDRLGQQVEITNIRTGATAVSPMQDGGFDPVAIEAVAEDTLRVTAVHQDGTDTSAYGVVPPKSRPRVVRTVPPIGKTNVPLNSVIVVVFNQPMDSASLSGAMLLRQGTVDVAGSVSSEAKNGVVVSGRFTPAAPLTPLTRYQLVVTPDARSLDGEPLERTLVVQFTTAASGGLGTLLLTVSTTGLKPDDDGYLYGIDAAPSRRIGNNETKLLTGMKAGPVEIRLGEFDTSCGVAPQDRITVTVPAGDTVRATFTVNCYFSIFGRIMFASNRASDTGPAGTNWWSIEPDGTLPYLHSDLAPYDGDLAIHMYGSFAWTQGGSLWFYNWDCCLRQLTFSGGVQSPSLSSSGWKVAYTQRLGDSEVYDLMVVDPLNPQPSIVGSIAPDRVTRRFSPAWSPNDQVLVFGTDTSINSILLDGTGEQVLVRTTGPVVHLDWSSRTHRIVFNAPAIADPSQPTMSGTGAWVVGEDGQGLVQLMSPTANVQFNTPRWSPAGDRLLFSRASAGISSLWMSRPDGGQAVELAGVGTVNVKPLWIKSPTGAKSP